MRTASTTPTVPFLDLRSAHEGLKPELLAEIADLIDSGAFTNGPQVREFEEAFAEYCDTTYCVGVASGLDALRLALLAAGIEPGDEVIVPANTFVATLEAVTQAGGRPALVDASEDDWNLDVAATQRAIGPRTRFLMPVHLYGQLADLRQLEQLGVAIVEDACQAHGATRDGVRAGAGGVAAAFSFYPGKNLGAFGDAGAVVTDDEALAERVRAARARAGREVPSRRRGLDGAARHDPGARPAAQASAARRLERRAARGGRPTSSTLSQASATSGSLRWPRASEPVWHLFVVRTSRRDELAGFLRERGIATGLPLPAAAAPLARPTRGSATARATSRSRRRWRARCSRCRSSPG